MVDSNTCEFCGLPLVGTWWSRGKEPVDSGPSFCCYGCRFASSVAQEKGTAGSIRWTLTCLGIAIFFSMNLMVFTMAMWSMDVYDVQPDGTQAAMFSLFRWLCLLLSLPVLMLLGIPLLFNAVHDMRTGRFSTDLLILGGVTAAYVFSTVSVLSGSGRIYFEVGAMVLVMVTLGRWFEATGRHNATEALDELADLLPKTVHRITGSLEESVPLADVRVGDMLHVRAGDRFASDGRLVGGRACIDEQIFTGESRPVERNTGDSVYGGTTNLDGDLKVQVTATPRSGSFGRLMDVLRRARESRGHYQQCADRIAAWFLPAVTAVAVMAFIWHSQASLEKAFLTSLAVVLIACPCALGLATPLAVWTAIGQALKHGVLFKNSEALERTAEIRAVRFDKTGTMTTGRPQVVDFVAAPNSISSNVIPFAVELATASIHPFSRAIVKYATDARALGHLCRTWDGCAPDGHPPTPSGGCEVPFCTITDRLTVSGLGVEGMVNCNGNCPRAKTGVDPDRLPAGLYGSARRVRLGKPEFVQENWSAITDRITSTIAGANENGQSIVAVGCAGHIDGVFLIDEQLRPEARAAIAGCRELELDVAILTGDRSTRASAVAESLSDGKQKLSFVGDLRPEDKLREIRSARQTSGSVAMIGDGINDAPALAAADVGFALGCGADVTRDSASVCLLSDDLRRVPWSIRFARRTTRIIRQNLFWAFAYNTVGIALAATGLLNPVIAAGLMVGSSVLVISNSLRINNGCESNTPTRDTGSVDGVASESQLRTTKPNQSSGNRPLEVSP